ncbi:hypothetical protein BS50DRAFT_386390 [Corynespora cassiicola Philippines]|uniref:Uncharacterized protein n=1 Tax=Corynespora cassiicola Philippines TaxID=1448308 RepID=A0A2T2NP70_CORCC|nr:hypothetical protein BS50DRAFT_386390 [Corynespora cassiicola Philippines]
MAITWLWGDARDARPTISERTSPMPEQYGSLEARKQPSRTRARPGPYTNSQVTYSTMVSSWTTSRPNTKSPSNGLHPCTQFTHADIAGTKMEKEKKRKKRAREGIFGHRYTWPQNNVSPSNWPRVAVRRQVPSSSPRSLACILQ